MRLIDADALPKYTGYALSADAVANPNNPDFYCGNERSDYYGDNTEYKTTCEEWEGKE